MENLVKVFERQLSNFNLSPQELKKNSHREMSDFGNEFPKDSCLLIAVFQNQIGSEIRIMQVSENDFSYINANYDVKEIQGNGVPIFVENEKRIREGGRESLSFGNSQKSSLIKSIIF
jgi:hypothetical protein